MSISLIVEDRSFKMVYLKDKTRSIFMYSSNINFLKEKWDLLANYTRKIDPQAKIGTLKIEKALVSKKKFTHRICCNEVLPRLVAAQYGKCFVRQPANCHGASLVAGGIYPAMSKLHSPFDLELTAEKTQTITNLDQIASGDLVCVYKNSTVFGDPYCFCEHSFVFLDHEISLSMNGVNKKLKVHSTTSILALYKYSEDCLKSYSGSALTFTILRKKPEWIYPERIITSLTYLYSLNESLQEGIFNRYHLQLIAHEFKAYKNRAKQTPAEMQASFLLLHQVLRLIPPITRAHL